MVNQIYPPNTSDTKVPFLDFHLSISNGFVSSKIYDKRDDFDFDIVNFPFLDGDVPRRPSYGVYISQLIRFARVCSHVDDDDVQSLYDFYTEIQNNSISFWLCLPVHSGSLKRIDYLKQLSGPPSFF